MRFRCPADRSLRLSRSFGDGEQYHRIGVLLARYGTSWSGRSARTCIGCRLRELVEGITHPYADLGSGIMLALRHT